MRGFTQRAQSRECVRILPVNDTAILVLASNSPRRQHLLGLGGWRFRVQPATIDESVQNGESPASYVVRMALSKAHDCAASYVGDQPVVAADTVVVDGRDVLGKPADREAAVQMLKRLRGHMHKVYTAVAVMRTGREAAYTDLCITDVPMRSYTDEEIQSYVASDDPLDKAGAYAIQHPDFRPVEAFRGCYASVMGLPICHLTRILQKINIRPARDVPESCQAAHDYRCTVFHSILMGEPVG